MEPAPMNTVRDAIASLEEDGFTAQVRPVAEGLVSDACSSECDPHDPSACDVAHTYRFEGMSNPSDESAVFAVALPCGVKGTWTVAFGPNMDPAEASFAPKLMQKSKP